jgi:alpha-glucosidase
MPQNSLTSFDGVHHDGSQQYVSNPYPKRGETVQIRLRTALDSPISRVLLRTVPDGEQHFAELAPREAEAACRWWRGELRVSMPVENYRFVLLTPHGVWHYNGLGISEHAPTDYHDFRLVADYRPPLWVTQSVFYQIFPDRFADGDSSNNVRDGEWIYEGKPVRARRWDELPEKANAVREFFGGDLQGITQKLDYLRQLGVNALYLNPIFTAPSSHRYDTSDYESVDPHLGGEAALSELSGELHAHDMRLMLDIVPNHCGAEHPWFQAALQNPQAPTAEFFLFEQHPQRYVSWMGVPSLPKLNYQSAALREKMYAGPDAVFRRWLRPPFSIDAWRVDVANMLGRLGATQQGNEVACGMRATVKEENPEAYLLGENFYDATGQLQGDQYDANMNYRGFTVPLWEWLTEQSIRLGPFGPDIATGTPLSTPALVEAWATFRAPIPWALALQQFTLLDSHDTARIRTLVGGNEALQRLAVALQMTYPGVPCVLYGDEIGLEADDADAARRPMPWNEALWNTDLLAFYKQLIQLRRSSSALSRGGFQVLLTETDTLAYLRSTAEEHILVVAHRGENERPSSVLPLAHGGIADGTPFMELFSGAEAMVQHGGLLLPAMPQGVALWQAHLSTSD